jgi:hypothetical protein
LQIFFRTECSKAGRLFQKGAGFRDRFNPQGEAEKDRNMKYAGLLVMPAGFFLTVAAVLLFPDPTTCVAFVVCGLAVEAMGLGVAIRGHMAPKRGRHGQVIDRELES